MRPLSEEQRSVCSMQAKLFELSTGASEDGSAVFVRRFMHSDVAKRIDDGTYAYAANTIEQVIHDVDAEYGGKPYGSVRYSRSEMHWMGYLYRFMCFALQLSSKRAYGVIGARELRTLYQPYHSLSSEQAIERILEARGMDADALMGVPNMSIAKGVEVLKRIRSPQRS